MMRLLILIIISISLVGCKTQYSDFFPYYDDGTPKPYVAELPVFNECSEELQGDVTKEITKDIRKRLMKDGRVFMPSEKVIQTNLAACNKNELLQAKDLMPFLHFQPAHFVVVLELIEHKSVPYVRGQIKPLYIASIEPHNGIVLMMKMRLKIVDIRGNDPKVIRQEILESNHVLHKSDYEIALSDATAQGFKRTCIGTAYERLARDIAERIEKITSYQR